jgi:hypothetical protein
MRLLKLSAISMMLLSALSCSKSSDGDLTVGVVGSTSYILDDDVQSCANKLAVALAPSTATPSNDITSNYISYRGMTLSWKNTTDSVDILKIDLQFTSSSFTKTCTISGDELAALFAVGTGATSTAWDGSLAAASVGSLTTRTMWDPCQLRCGGLSVDDKTKAFTVTGKLIVYGIQTGPAPDYDQKPVKASTSITATYQP